MLSLRASLREFCCVKFITAKIYGHVCFLTAFPGAAARVRARGLAPVLAVLRGGPPGAARGETERTERNLGRKLQKRGAAPASAK